MHHFLELKSSYAFIAQMIKIIVPRIRPSLRTCMKTSYLSLLRPSQQKEYSIGWNLNLDDQDLHWMVDPSQAMLD